LVLLSVYYADLNSIEIDPRARWAQSITQITDLWLGERSQIPPAIAADLLRGPLQELDSRLIAALQSGHYGNGDQAIGEFKLQLQNNIRTERAQGRLKPISPSSEIERNLAAFRLCGYRAIELDSLLRVLPDERIIEVGIRAVKTASRTIGRGELVDVLKPTTQTNVNSWLNQFPRDSELRELEEAAERRENPLPQSWDNYNHDLPRPMKLGR
jgi:hypothetical protein